MIGLPNHCSLIYHSVLILSTSPVQYHPHHSQRKTTSLLPAHNCILSRIYQTKIVLIHCNFSVVHTVDMHGIIYCISMQCHIPSFCHYILCSEHTPVKRHRQYSLVNICETSHLLLPTSCYCRNFKPLSCQDGGGDCVSTQQEWDRTAFGSFWTAFSLRKVKPFRL